MPIKKLTAAEVGLPEFEPGVAREGNIFDLSSHRRAREALEFGLGIDDLRYNIFVLGEEQSGRLTPTVISSREKSYS